MPAAVTIGPKQHLGQRPDGRLVVGRDVYAAALRDLPTIVETYKTYDDINMVKCTDVGQVMAHDASQAYCAADQDAGGLLMSVLSIHTPAVAAAARSRPAAKQPRRCLHAVRHDYSATSPSPRERGTASAPLSALP